MENAAGKAEEDESVEERDKAPPRDPPVPRSTKRNKRAATDGAPSGPAAGLCDDVLINILARQPARTAVACTALSKHHRRIIRSPDFVGLHFRLAPPLPRPHIVYLATAPITRRPELKKPVNVFHGFHIAGAGLRSGDAPIRSLSGRRYLGTSYINTCNGVVLLATKKFSCPCTCILWNPAVADVVEEVTVPDSDYQVLGLGYGRRSKTYKLLLCRRHEYSLAICSLGDVDSNKQPTRLLSTALSAEVNGEIRLQTLYADGTIYLLQQKRTPTIQVLALDVDDEAVTSIGMPTGFNAIFSKLMELSGRPCVAVKEAGGSQALWVLSVDHQWVRRYLIPIAEQPLEHRFHLFSLTAVWDCGGVLVLYSEGVGVGKLFCVYNIATGKMLNTTLHRDRAPPGLSEYAICWGYRPTLVSPGSIIGNVDQGVVSRHRELPSSDDMMKALQPVVERDRKQGHDATLDTVSFVDILVCIMQRLPDGVQDLQDLVELLIA